jgi:O-antigen ligase
MMELSGSLQKPKKRYLYLITSVLMVLFLAATVVFEESTAFLDIPFSSQMSDVEFYLSFSIVLFLAMSILYISFHYYKISINWIFIVLCALLLAGDVIAVLTFPTESHLASDPSSVYLLTPFIRLRFIASWFIACFAFYLIFAVFPKLSITSRTWDFYFYAVIAVALVAILYSYISEGASYSNIFSHIQNEGDYQPPQSFTNNRNTYGALLWMGIMATLFMHVRNHRWWDFLIVLFLYLNVLLTISRTSIICSSIFILAWFIWFYAATVKTHPVGDNVVLGVILFLIVLAVIVVNTPLIYHLPRIRHLVEKLKDQLGNVQGFTLDWRTPIWSATIDVWKSSPLTILFGLGDWNFTWYLGWYYEGFGAGAMGYAHSGFFDVLGRLGLFGIVMYGLMLAYFVFLIIKSFKAKHRTTFTTLLMLVMMLCHSFSESTDLLDATTEDLVLLVMIFCPLLTDIYQDHDPEIEGSFAGFYAESNPRFPQIDWSPLNVCKLAYLFLLPFFVTLVGMGHIFQSYYSFGLFDNVWISVGMGMVFVAFPIMLFNFVSILRKKRPARAFVALGFALLWAVSTPFIADTFQTWWSLFFPGLSAALLIVITYFTSEQDGEAVYQMLLVSLCFVLIACVVLLVDLQVSYFYLDYSREQFAFVGLLLFGWLFPLWLIVFTPARHLLFCPFEQWWERLEEMVFRVFIKRRFIAISVNERFYYGLGKEPAPRKRRKEK